MGYSAFSCLLGLSVVVAVHPRSRRGLVSFRLGAFRSAAGGHADGVLVDECQLGQPRSRGDGAPVLQGRDPARECPVRDGGVSNCGLHRMRGRRDLDPTDGGFLVDPRTAELVLVVVFAGPTRLSALQAPVDRRGQTGLGGTSATPHRIGQSRAPSGRVPALAQRGISPGNEGTAAPVQVWKRACGLVLSAGEDAWVSRSGDLREPDEPGDRPRRGGLIHGQVRRHEKRSVTASARHRPGSSPTWDRHIRGLASSWRASPGGRHDRLTQQAQDRALVLLELLTPLLAPGHGAQGHRRQPGAAFRAASSTRSMGVFSGAAAPSQGAAAPPRPTNLAGRCRVAAPHLGCRSQSSGVGLSARSARRSSRIDPRVGARPHRKGAHPCGQSSNTRDEGL